MEKGRGNAVLTDAVRRLDRDSDLIGERESQHGERGAILVGLGLEKPGILFQPGPGQVGERGRRALPVAYLTTPTPIPRTIS